MPNGDYSMPGEQVIIQHVTRQHTGIIYIHIHLKDSSKIIWRYKHNSPAFKSEKEILGLNGIPFTLKRICYLKVI